VLLTLGVASNRFFTGTSKDYFVASHSIGPVLLLMSVFGTTMTAFALVGSTGKAFTSGVGVYGLMASWSGLVHSAVFFLVGIKVWAIGKQYGYVTQCQFFRDRYESNFLGHLLFPILVGLVIPYLLIGLIGAGRVVLPITSGAFPDLFPHPNPALNGGIPPWLTNLVIAGVVLIYVFFGGLRGAVWANTLQTIVFMTTGVVAFYLISNRLGGMDAASQQVLEKVPERLAREGMMGQLQFFTYCFVPLSVGMFPHLFQHWLTAKSAKTFRLTVVAHPIFIMIVWVPCILIGIWGAAFYAGQTINPNQVLGRMVGQLIHDPYVSGILGAGILAAIMSSLDSQFMCLGTMFTNDVIVHHFGEDHFNDKQKILLARCFIVLIVVITYILALYEPAQVFDLGVWCFSGFGSLFPIIVGAVYWKRATKAGAIASVLAMAATWGYFFYNDVIIGEAHGEDELLIAGMMPVAIIFFVTLVVFVAVSLVTKPPSEETIRKFFPEPIQK
ncbi:MAG: sodium:solute symporter family protein, partial [Candidatus Omnitrophica bacterium]|nr:sodium:solute symporter family protein [Candidatus Omnitrophota bacterium]